MGEKRGAGEEVAMGGREAKKVKKVAEMVLALAAMGKMRRGRLPSEAERELMADAREKLAEVCVAFSPKDVFPRDAFGSLIDDWGLSKLNEQQRLGFRPPKISIAEKLMLSKRKFQMEKSEEYNAALSQRVQGSSGPAVESRSTSHPARVSPQERPSHMPVSSASPQPAAFGPVPATNLTSLPYQLPTSEVRPIVPNPLPSSHTFKDSSATLPRADRPHFRMDGRPNGSAHTAQAQVQAHLSGNHTTVRTPPWYVQPQSVSSGKMVSDNKVPMHTTQVEGAADVKSGVPPEAATSNSLVTQSRTGNPPIMPQNLQGVNFVQVPPMRNIHAEIGKIIQKFLQPQHPEQTTWTPLSRDYMNKALTCQICQSSTSELDSVLICDNCEKGFHLKCLQTTNQKGVQRGEWHCLRCLTLSNGKPLPPKYGRVMRNISKAKVSSNVASVRPSPDRKSGNIDEKVNQQKVNANGNIPMQNNPTGSAGNISSQPAFDPNLVNASAMQIKEILSARGKVDDNISSGTHPNDSSSTACHTSYPNLSRGELSEEKKSVELKLKSLVNSDATASNPYNAQAPGNQQGKDRRQPNSTELRSNQSTEDNCVVNGSTETCDRETPQSNSIDDPKSVRVDPAETLTTMSGATEFAKSSPDNSYAVSWIGDVIQVVDGKTYYQSCCVNGIIYKVHDHATVLFDNGNLIPSKIQAMWEDTGTQIKWVFISRCYFPNDLPEAVGRPCGLESDEVYESACGSTILASLIQGPCEVLPPNKFAAEKERRARMGTGADDRKRPCYLCKWIYDESKGLFRDISC